MILLKNTISPKSKASIFPDMQNLSCQKNYPEFLWHSG